MFDATHASTILASAGEYTRVLDGTVNISDAPDEAYSWQLYP